MKIYTKTGDEGMTGLLGGRRVQKYDATIEMVGQFDELNAAVGLTLTALPSSQPWIAIIKELQADLFLLGSVVAGYDAQDKLVTTLAQRTSQMEHAIDMLTEQLPPLRNFILPGGGQTGARVHWLRTVVRRVEREWILFTHAELLPELDDAPAYAGAVTVYLNRLSDFFFVLARYVNQVEQVPEDTWIL